ncbi:MAG: CCA tRNA nucleotidyltransferase, partial [Phycisphaeraceae bacterium]|nr:CCA tRNA nucleotidyltransferase [Phycisphaeraceae bacterium]
MDPARQAAIRIIEQLRRHGHEAYLAGGSVRDRLLGLWPKDFDVATSALPQRIRAIHPRARQVGEAFGVLLVKVDRKWIEVATFRKDGDYLDGRRPTNVEFCDAQQDAHRRDFTINGLFEDPLCQALPAGVLESIQPPRTRPDGAPDPTDPGIPLNDPVQMRAIIDHVGGIDDLRHGLVRAIGDPRRRFAEDYLRMLRAVRFAARLGFAIEPVTEAAIGDFANLLGRISRERIGQEVRWMLESAPTSARPIAPDSAGRPGRMIQT